jgi:hypothetical protein
VDEERLAVERALGERIHADAWRDFAEAILIMQLRRGKWTAEGIANSYRQWRRPAAQEQGDNK